MSDDKGMSSSEVAYRAVKAMQDQKAHADSRWTGMDVSSKSKTPMVVWGAFFGLLISAFQVDPSEPMTLVAIPAAGIAIGAGIGWSIGRLFRFVFGTLPRLLFGGVSKIVKGEPREPPV